MFREGDKAGRTRLYKIVIAGPKGSGKTQLILRAAENRFREEYEPTVGAEFTLITNRDNNTQLQIWDVTSKAEHSSHRQICYKNAHAIIFTCDVTNLLSFEDLKIYLDEAVKNLNLATCPLYLVLTKTDLQSERKITKEVAELFASQHGLIFINETSAKENVGVKEFFERLTSDLHRQQVNNPIKQKNYTLKEEQDYAVSPYSGKKISKNPLDYIFVAFAIVLGIGVLALVAYFLSPLIIAAIAGTSIMAAVTALPIINIVGAIYCGVVSCVMFAVATWLSIRINENNRGTSIVEVKANESSSQNKINTAIGAKPEPSNKQAKYSTPSAQLPLPSRPHSPPNIQIGQTTYHSKSQSMSHE